jgi:hypothetical protein
MSVFLKDNFEKGNCLDCSAGGCAKMGYNTPLSSRGIKYLMTYSKAPFCANALLSEISISASNVKTAGEIGLIIQTGSLNQTILLTKYILTFSSRVDGRYYVVPTLRFRGKYLFFIYC